MLFRPSFFKGLRGQVGRVSVSKFLPENSRENQRFGWIAWVAVELLQAKLLADLIYILTCRPNLWEFLGRGFWQGRLPVLDWLMRMIGKWKPWLVPFLHFPLQKKWMATHHTPPPKVNMEWKAIGFFTIRSPLLISLCECTITVRAKLFIGSKVPWKLALHREEGAKREGMQISKQNTEPLIQEIPWALYCPPEGRGGEKGWSANLKTKHTEPCTQGLR